MKNLMPIITLIIIALVSLITSCSEDTALTGQAGKPNKVAVECADSNDNDDDELTDLADPGCESKKDNDETNCGDSICEGAETCSSCTLDCGECTIYCGDGLCNGDETCSTCLSDCGACPDTCNDSDAGFEIYVQGTVSGTRMGAPYSYSDTCITEEQILERFCAGPTPAYANATCVTNFTNRCVNGACTG